MPKTLSTVIAKTAALVVVMAGVAGCSNFYSLAPRAMIKTVGNFSIISTAVVMGTDKTLSDHFVSWNVGKDCSTVRVEQGRTYCREDEPNPMPNVYCYPTLGDVMCYAQPDPLRDPDARTGRSSAPQNGQKSPARTGIL